MICWAFQIFRRPIVLVSFADSLHKRIACKCDSGYVVREIYGINCLLLREDGTTVGSTHRWYPHKNTEQMVWPEKRVQ